MLNLTALFLISLIVGIECQPECQTKPLPQVIPISSKDNITLDLYKYFSGNNLTLSLLPNTTNLFIRPLIEESKHRQYRWGQLASAYAWQKYPNTINLSLLITTTQGNYYLYYTDTNQWDTNVNSIYIGSNQTFGKCSNHILNDNGVFVIDCEGVPSLSNLTNYIIFGSIITKSISAYPQKIYTGKSGYSTKLMLLTNTLIIRAYLTSSEQVPTHNNSYIELWNPNTHQLLAIYDRTYLQAKKLSIVDISGGDTNAQGNGYSDVYILDYESGVYWLDVLPTGLIVSGFWSLQFYDKVSVSMNRIVVARRGTVTQLQQSKISKYQLSSDFVLEQIQSNGRYILVRSVGTLSIFRRGQPQPYRIIQLYQASKFILFDSTSFITFDSILDQVTLVYNTITEPFLHAFSIRDQSAVTIKAVSSYYSQNAYCQQKITMQPRIIDEQGIWNNGFNTQQNQNVFMNRPGETIIQLDKYGSGSNLTYNIDFIYNRLNLQYQTYQINNFTTIFKLNNPLNNLKVYRIYTCDHLVRMQFNNLLSVYFSCSALTDLINQCQQVYRKDLQSFPILVQHYQLNKLDKFYPESFLEAEVLQLSNQTLNITRVFPQDINHAETICTIAFNTTINKLQFIESVDGKIGLFILLPRIKEIQYWQHAFDSKQCTKQFVINSQALKWQYFSPSNFSIIDYKPRSAYIRLLYVQFNEVAVIRITLPTFSTTLSIAPFLKAQLKEVPLNGNFTYSIQYPYVIVISQRIILHSYLITHNQIRFIRQLPRYTMFQNTQIQSLTNTQIVAIQLLNGYNRRALAFYRVAQLSTFSTYYAQMPLNDEILAYVNIDGVRQPFVIVVPIAIPFYSAAASIPTKKVYQSPSLVLTLTDQLHSLSKQQFYIRLANNGDAVKHIVTVTVANFPQNITYGDSYPYSRLQLPIDKQIIVPMRGWFRGNVLFYQYNCYNCMRRDTAYPLIKVKDKISLSEYIASYNGLQVLYREQLSILYILNSNIIYTTNITTKQLGKAIVINTQEECIQMQRHFDSLLVLCGKSLFGVSLVNDAWWIVSQFSLPSSGSKLLYYRNAAVVLSSDGVYIIAVLNTLQLMMGDFIPIEEVGNICSIEMVFQQSNSSYMLILTLCDIGIQVITFNIKQPSILNYLHRQTLYLSTALSQLHFNLPSETSFIQTLTRKQQSSLRVFTILNKFNSFEWILKLSNSDVVVSLQLVGIINKYTDYQVFGRATIAGNYLMLEQRNKYDSMYSVYDLVDYAIESGYNQYYIMQTMPYHYPTFSIIVRLPRQDNKQFIISLTDKSILLFQVRSVLRIQVTDPQTIISQSLQIIASSLTFAKTVEIRLKGIEVFIWQWWYTLLIIIGAVVIGSMGFIIGRRYWKKYQTKKKLIPLLKDYDEFEQDIQHQQHGRFHLEQKTQQINIDGNINESIRGSVEPTSS